MPLGTSTIIISFKVENVQENTLNMYFGRTHTIRYEFIEIHKLFHAC